jgi:tetratricopeptide (TPR) repeat protein
MLRPSIRTCLVIILLIPAAERFLAARTETWEVRSPNFLVLTDANEKQGRSVALQFEVIRAVFRQFFIIPGAAKDPVVTIIAFKSEDGWKRLLPEGGSWPPGGVYVAGPEKNYIALRLDQIEVQKAWAALRGRADDPFENIHHGYVHLLMRRLTSQLPLGLLSQLPLWMVEGSAEFFGSTEVEGGQLVVGAPSSTNLKVLLGTKLLPLGTLFAVDASSPYYHEENRTSILYAQSWLLTKYLITRDWREGTHRVTDFVALLGQSVKPEEAARRTIGDPVRLQEELQRYLRRDFYTAARLPLPPSLDANDFTAEPASPAELEAVGADFMALAPRYAEAHKMLEEDLQLAMSLLLPTRRDEATAARAKAQEMGEDLLRTSLLPPGLRDEATAARAESSLRAAIKTAPKFAPAYEALANLLARRPETQEEAYRIALQAVSLKAGNVHYRLNLSWVLEMMGRVDEAVRVAEFAVSVAKTRDERRDAATRLAMARQQQEHQKGMEEESEISDHPDYSEPPELEDSPKLAEGIIEKAECNGSTTIEVTVKTSSGEIHLYSDRYMKLFYSALNFTLEENMNPCRDLQGWHARISYRPAKDPANAGEMMAVLLVKD